MNAFKAPAQTAVSAPVATPTPTPAPTAPEPVRVPGVNDPDVVAARRTKAQDEFANRRGRESTRLTPATGTRDVAYSRTLLG